MTHVLRSSGKDIEANESGDYLIVESGDWRVESKGRKIMRKEQENIVSCSTFEELLTDYLDRTLDGPAHKAAAAHSAQLPSLPCPTQRC